MIRADMRHDRDALKDSGPVAERVRFIEDWPLARLQQRGLAVSLGRYLPQVWQGSVQWFVPRGLAIGQTCIGRSDRATADLVQGQFRPPGRTAVVPADADGGAQPLPAGTSLTQSGYGAALRTTLAKAFREDSLLECLCSDNGRSFPRPGATD